VNSFSVTTRSRKIKGIKYIGITTSYRVLLDTDEATIFCDKTQRSNHFKVGDKCSYDSYNLVYIGTILKMNLKSVIIEPYNELGKFKTTRLGWHEFCWRNIEFNLERVGKHNQLMDKCI